MKKFLHILLLTVYLPAALGVGFSIHYCGGEVESVGVFAYSEEPLDECCAHDVEPGCCDDDWKYVKLDDNSQLVKTAEPFQVTPAIALVQPVFELAALNFSPGYRQLYTSSYKHGPPPGSLPPVFLRHRSLLI